MAVSELTGRASAPDTPSLQPRRSVLPVPLLTLLALLLAPWAPAAAQVSPTGQLSLQQSEVRVQWGSLTAPPNELSHPSLAEGSAPGLYALAALGLGGLRTSAQVADGPGLLLDAYAQLELVFVNSGGTPIHFDAGDVRAAVDAGFLRTLGTDSQGSASTSFRASLSGSASGVAGYASVNTFHEDANRAGWPVAHETITAGFGFTATGNASPSGTAVVLAFPAFSLQPQAGLSLRLTMGAYAAAGSNAFGASGWSAITDASHSALLAMRLPAGTVLVSPQPLPWVSVVPEPGTALLWALGLAGLAVRARRVVCLHTEGGRS